MGLQYCAGSIHSEEVHQLPYGGVLDELSHRRDHLVGILISVEKEYCGSYGSRGGPSQMKA